MKFISIKGGEGELFDNFVKDCPAFVKFYSNGCGHCTDMAPAWAGLKNELNKLDHLNANIIEVEATALSDIKSPCAKNIEGYPTIIQVLENGKKGKEYNGNRSKEDMMKFINKTFKKINSVNRTKSVTKRNNKNINTNNVAKGITRSKKNMIKFINKTFKKINRINRAKSITKRKKNNKKYTRKI